MKTLSFDSLRARGDVFHYDSYHVEHAENATVLTFNYRIANSQESDSFVHTITLPLSDRAGFEAGRYDAAVFYLGMAEVVNYYKITCAKTIMLHTGRLSSAQESWFKELFYNGLGEFFFQNKIFVSRDELFSFEYDSDASYPKQHIETEYSVMVPIGGGKDSIVSYHLLSRSDAELSLFAINPIAATRELMERSPQKSYCLGRKLDAKVLDYNARGYLNGHIPFSSIVAFTAVLTAMMSRQRYIALSNESSANEGNVEHNGTVVNHQYSKSLHFENHFRAFVHEYITEDVEYFSFLRPLHELQIAALFAQIESYHFIFRSCNVGSKKNIWCGACPKCLFTFIILHPFIGAQKMKEIFGKDLFADAELLEDFIGLVDANKIKPFECVGTYDEVNYALRKSIEHYGDAELPFLLAYYKEHFAAAPLDATALFALDGEHNVPESFYKVLKEHVDRLN